MEFVQARHYTRLALGDVRRKDLIVVHTMESAEKPDTAENVARWFAGHSAPKASPHFNIDLDSIVQSVRIHDVAWTAPGANHNGIHLEHAGRASQAPRDWLDPYSVAMLARSAKLAGHLCRAYKIPVRYVTPAMLKDGKRGITTHHAVTIAFRKGTHTDPGKDFPMAMYLGLVRAYKAAEIRVPGIR